MIITHTELPETLRGIGIAKRLPAFAVKYAWKAGTLRIPWIPAGIVAECGYANRFLNRDAPQRRREFPRTQTLTNHKTAYSPAHQPSGYIQKTQIDSHSFRTNLLTTVRMP